MTSGRRHLALVLAILALFTLALGATACGSDESEGKGLAEEGDPVRVGNLEFTVVSTRRLYRDDEKDAAYLVGQPPVGKGLTWFGVFLEVENTGDKTESMPGMTIRDSTRRPYSAFPSDYPAALSFGETIKPGEQLPRPGTTEGEEPEGALVIFRVGPAASENQPLTLRIEGFEPEKAEVKLDL